MNTLGIYSQSQLPIYQPHMHQSRFKNSFKRILAGTIWSRSTIWVAGAVPWEGVCTPVSYIMPKCPYIIYVTLTNIRVI